MTQPAPATPAPTLSDQTLWLAMILTTVAALLLTGSMDVFRASIVIASITGTTLCIHTYLWCEYSRVQASIAVERDSQTKSNELDRQRERLNHEAELLRMKFAHESDLIEARSRNKIKEMEAARTFNITIPTDD